MARGLKSSEPLAKITTRIYARDQELLRQFFPLGYQGFIRDLIRKSLQSLERKARSATEQERGNKDA